MFKRSTSLLLINSIVFTAISANVFAQTSVAKSGSVVEVFVTTTREEKAINELSESVGILTEKDLELIAPSHPADALNRIPGVHINNLGGEGHMSSIRQPITTSGVYLFLEDGIPTRPTGFFNHNGLYEINIPQSSRVEVVKGPGSALYGSDAIGGMINVITKAAPEESEAIATLEVGASGWQRSLISAGGKVSDSTNVRADYNYTQSDGFRDEATYDRNSLSLRADTEVGDQWSIRTVLSSSQINQAGVSSLEEDDYKNNTKRNKYHGDIGFRQVDALRASMEINYKATDQHLITVTPYYRNNSMVMMPSWMMDYDPNLRNYDFESYGLLSKFRSGFLNGKGEVIIGLDIDSTPSSYEEKRIEFDDGADIYTNYEAAGEYSYLFDTTQKSISPYLHAEYQLSEYLRLNGGIRFDKFDVDYTNFLSTVTEASSHLRPASQSLSFENTSPKLGAVVEISDFHSAYINYRYSFRAPTAGALFRSGSSQDTTLLQPVNSVSSEIGFRGEFAQVLSYEIVYYDMKVEDDIVSIINDTTRKSVNAGETEHKGWELGFDWKIVDELQLGVSYTSTDQTYTDFSYVFYDKFCFCNQEVNVAGNDVSKAPKSLANVRLAYEPKGIEGFRAELEWMSVGKYYTDQTNTQMYDGHDLYNLRMHYELNSQMSVFARVANLTDELYSTYTSNKVGNDTLSYRPGRPRSFTLGINWSF